MMKKKFFGDLKDIVCLRTIGLMIKHLTLKIMGNDFELVVYQTANTKTCLKMSFSS